MLTKNNKVLVTGADGFIGSHLVELLVEQGHQVRAMTQYNSFNFWGWLEDSPVKNQIEVVSGDVRDPEFVSRCCEGIDVIFHLAALIAIPYSYHAPRSYVEVNALGTLNVCQAALTKNVKRVIHTSTSEVYGTALQVPINESHPLQPQSPYSASKISADAMAKSFHLSFNLPLVIARPFNTFGPRQSARAVIPTLITQIMAGAKEIKIGDPEPTRDFNFVEDTCRGMILLAQSEKAVGEVVNIGSGREYSIGDTFKLIRDLTGKDVHLITDQQRIRPANSEVFRLLCDNTKIKQLTGFETKYTFEQGLQKSVEWFSSHENLKKYKTDIYNV